MIVRILGEGQWRIDEGALADLNTLDQQVEDALAAGDEPALQSALARLLDEIRGGQPVADDELVESDLIVPDASSSLSEVSSFLAEQGQGEGLIPG
ncbi:hypothetical protein GCM10027030_15110 [Luteococcus sediminum]|uniref:PspA-associated protein PspAA n=1 Tax=Luteococcus sp. TaxID=1969402 RepID=UPI003736E285